jgi:hypothetical protein
MVNCPAPMILPLRVSLTPLASMMLPNTVSLMLKLLPNVRLLDPPAWNVPIDSATVPVPTALLLVTCSIPKSLTVVPPE